MKKILLLLSLLVATASFGRIPTRQKNTYVNDFAHVLSTNEVEALNAKIHRMERLAGVQMAVVLVDKVPAEYDIDEFALLIGRKWHVGKNKNGIVYVAAIDQHKQRLELGREVTAKLTDGKSAEILDLMKPYFRKQDYNGGLDAMIEALGNEVIPAPTQSATPARQQTAVQAKEKPSTAADVFATIITAAIFIGIPVLIIVLIVRWRRRRRNMLFQQNMGYNNPGYGGGNYGNGNYPGGGYGNGGPVINNYGGGGGYGSGMGSNLGSFAAGAATGYAARTLQDHLSDDDYDRHHHHNNDDDNYDRNNVVDTSDNDNNDTDYSVNDEDRDSSNWGNYDNSSDSDSSSDNSDSSSDSGYDGDRGATSDW